MGLVGNDGELLSFFGSLHILEEARISACSRSTSRRFERMTADYAARSAAWLYWPAQLQLQKDGRIVLYPTSLMAGSEELPQPGDACHPDVEYALDYFSTDIVPMRGTNRDLTAVLFVASSSACRARISSTSMRSLGWGLLVLASESCASVNRFMGAQE